MIKLLLAAALFVHTASPAWVNNLAAAKEQAKKENKLILLNFSGSDWCIPCIRMHEEIFNTTAFEKYATENLICINADFPRKSKNQLPKDQQKLNDALAEKYNTNGSFPFTLLLDSDGNKLKVWDGFYKDGIANFVAEIREASGK